MRTRTLRTAVVVAVASALAITLLGPQASADELTAKRVRVKQQIAKTKSELNESTKELSAAVVQVDKAQNKLDAAAGRLTTTRQELRVAQTKDAHMATKLQQARADLAAAVAAVMAGQARLDAQEEEAGRVIRDQYQQQTNLMPIALLVDPDSTEDLQTRLQWSTTLFDSAQAEIDRLTLIQRQLNAARARQAELKQRSPRLAARLLPISRSRKGSRLVPKVRKRRSRGWYASGKRLKMRPAQDVMHRDKARYSQLIKERASEGEGRGASREPSRHVSQRQQQSASGPRNGKAAQRSRSAAKQSDRSNHSRRTMSSAGHGFSFPVPARITSPFGMRFHPILRYWKLHDGTDFGAGCGTPIRAPGRDGSRRGTTTADTATG